MEATTELSLNVDRRNVVQVVKAKQYDNGTRFLKITLLASGKKISADPSATVTINARRGDGQGKAYAGKVNDDGTVTVPITYWMLELEDTITSCDVSIIDTAQKTRLSTLNILIEVEASNYSDGDISEDENYDLLATLINQVEELEDKVETAETARENAEESRVQAEQSRVSAEQSRISAEEARVAEEAERVSAEQARASAEQSRASAESARVTAEQSRVKAEQARASAETARESEEQKRVTAEQNRVSEEQKRVTAEAGRVSAEESRVTAEQSRVSAEQARVKAEQARVQAEEEREEAEAQRQETIADMEGTYAKLNQVVRYDAGQSLTDTQRQQVHDNVTRRVEQALDTPGWYRVAKMYSTSGQYTLTIRSRWSNNPSTVMKIFLNYSQIVDNLDACNISSFGYVQAIDKICFVNIDNYIYIDIHYVPNNNNRVSVELEGYVLGGVISDTALIQFESQGTEAKSDMVYNLKTGMSTQGGSLYVNGTDINGRIDDIVDGTTAVAKATQATRFYANDTRNDNQPPSWYQNSDNSKISLSEFKSVSAIGADSILTDSRGWCILYTIVPWGDSSGGTPIQVAVQSDTSSGIAKMAMRSALNNDSWGAWVRIATTDDMSSTPVTSVNGRSGAVTLSKSDVGLGNVDDVKQYSASNPPPYPVTSVNGKTGAVNIGTYSGCYNLNLTSGKKLNELVSESPFASDDSSVVMLKIYPLDGRTVQFRSSSSGLYESAFDITFFGGMVTTTWWCRGCSYIDSQSNLYTQKWEYGTGWEVSSSGNVIIEEVRTKNAV